MARNLLFRLLVNNYSREVKNKSLPDQDHHLSWTELSRKTKFERFSRGVEEVSFRLPDGSIHPYFVKREPSVVSVLAFSASQQVILVRQFRPGPNKMVYTLPGGGITSTDDPHSVALRELREETGYVGDLEFVARFYDDGYSTSVRHCFVAPHCEHTSQPQPDPTEFLSTVELPVPDFIRELRAGTVTDPEAAFAAIDYILHGDTRGRIYVDLAAVLAQSLSRHTT